MHAWSAAFSAFLCSVRRPRLRIPPTGSLNAGCLPPLLLRSLALPQSLVGLLGEEDPDTLAACWEALGAVAASVPKEMQPSFVRCLKVSACV